MIRGVLAVLAATVLVGIMGVLAVESRAIDEEYFSDHAQTMRRVEASRDDIALVTDSARGAFEVGRESGSASHAALQRLQENAAHLRVRDAEIVDNLALTARLGEYDAAIEEFAFNSTRFAEAQSAFADALRAIQEESPLLVKELRQENLRFESQNVFSLAIAVVEYATGVGNGDFTQISSRLNAMAVNERLRSQSPRRIDAFIESGREVLQRRVEAEAALAAVGESRVSESLWSLSNELLEDNRRRVSRAERAGLLLSICAGVLLLGTGYAMWRLQASYRELNRSNRELESMNDTLEERVVARTSELSAAYGELKESQVQLVQAEKLSSLGELVAGISHEINTPLWYLISNSTVLQERMGTISELAAVNIELIDAVRSQTDVKETLRRSVRKISSLLDEGLKDDIDEAQDLITDSIEGLEELTELAQSLKDFSRMDRAKHGELDVNEGIEKALLIAKNKLKTKVTIHKHFGELPRIHCSPSQINQVFLNLLTNAADAIDEAGDLVIRTAADADSVQIHFSDTGSGIADDVIEKIRDPFFTTKEVGQGTGLGLSIVDRIVNSHGGSLSFESESGKGTTVTVTLPIVAQGVTGGTDAAEADTPERTSAEAA